MDSAVPTRRAWQRSVSPEQNSRGQSILIDDVKVIVSQTNTEYAWYKYNQKKLRRKDFKKRDTRCDGTPGVSYWAVTTPYTLEESSYFIIAHHSKKRLFAKVKELDANLHAGFIEKSGVNYLGQRSNLYAMCSDKLNCKDTHTSGFMTFVKTRSTLELSPLPKEVLEAQ